MQLLVTLAQRIMYAVKFRTYTQYTVPSTQNAHQVVHKTDIQMQCP
jgi:hypothetical protein